MPNTIQIKRRLASTGVAGITLQPGEMLWQEFDNQLMIKKADGTIIPIGGEGTSTSEGMVTTANRLQTIAGQKNFNGIANITGQLQIGGTQVTSDAAELNKLDGALVTTAELNKLAGLSDGTATANKVLIVDASKNLDLGAGLISTSGVPTATNHLVNKKYVDDLAQGLDVKASVHVATAAALPACTYNNGSSGVGATLVADVNGELVVDGHTVNNNEYVLVKNQTPTLQNGIYTVTASGNVNSPFILTRRTDVDTGTELTSGSFCFVEQGTSNASTGWVLSTQGAIAIGTTGLVFTQFSSAGVADAGDGLQKVGTLISVKSASANRIAVSPGGVDLATISGLTASTEQVMFSVDTYGRITAASKNIPATAGVTIDCGVIE
jgi:hypothetical protein